MERRQIIASDALAYRITITLFYVAFVLSNGVSLWSMKCIQWIGFFFFLHRKAQDLIESAMHTPGIIQATTVQCMFIRKTSAVDKILQKILAFQNIQPFVMRTTNLAKLTSFTFIIMCSFVSEQHMLFDELKSIYLLVLRVSTPKSFLYWYDILVTENIAR